MKRLSIIIALACIILSGCNTLTFDCYVPVLKVEPNVIQIHILGSVHSPARYSEKTGDAWARIPFGTPLLEVVSVGAGGFTEMADKKRVRINRLKPGSNPKVERIFLDFTQTDSRKVEEVLRDGDTIYVPETWNLEVENKPRPFNQK